MKQIAQAGVQIWFYSDGTRFEYGSLATNVVGFLHGEFAAEYRRAIAAATTESHDRLARAGFVTGGRCFGYVNVRDASGVRREINRDEAAIVQRIFEFAASGWASQGLPSASTTPVRFAHDRSAAGPKDGRRPPSAKCCAVRATAAW